MNKKWNDTFEKIFETNTQDLTLLENQQHFELNSENHYLENLSYIHCQTDHINIVRIFSQLSSFFEIGFLFEQQKDLFVAAQGFAFGQILNLGEKNILIKFPKMDLYAMLKTNASAMLKKMTYGFLNKNKKMNGFVIKISTRHSVLVFTELAEPWLKLRLESLQKTLMKISFE